VCRMNQAGIILNPAVDLLQNGIRPIESIYCE
jgi:hypothetical protein